MVTLFTLNRRPHWFFIVCILIIVNPIQSGDTLFCDDFSSGGLESNWIFYGDPTPRILDSLGLPPPCFNNNGDSMRGSGVFSREVIEIGEGITVECDVLMSCRERGTWVTAALSIVTPGFRNELTQFDFIVAYINFSHSGELDWACPNRQGVIAFRCRHDDESIFNLRLNHQNWLLDKWHKYSMKITEDRLVNYYIDDSLMITSTVPIPDTLEQVRIMLGNRSSNWGIALHDNLVIYRP